MTTHKLIFATHNPNKLKEIKAMLPAWADLQSLDGLGYTNEIPENGATLEQNARNKAYHIYRQFNMTDCFADDTGLIVESLHGEPGVRSARFAGENADPQANMDLLLQKLKGETHRKASFKTVICLIYNGLQWLFEGEIKGNILEAPIGSGGFGYDPLFQPEGYFTSFAEMPPEEKNRISHRGIALRKMIAFLEKRHDSILSFESGKKEFLVPGDKQDIAQSLKE